MARGRPKSEGRRQTILDAAAACFVEEGFHRASMQQICAKAEMSPGALYRYFKSKDEIIEAIAESEREEIAEILRELSKTRHLLKSLKTISAEVLAYSADAGQGRLAIEVAAEASRNPRVAEIIAETDRELRGGLVGALTLAQTRGEVDAHLPAEAAADLLLALLDGLISRFLLNPPSDTASLQAALESLIARFLQPTELEGSAGQERRP